MEKINIFKKHLETYIQSDQIQNLINSFDNPQIKGLFININKIDNNELLNNLPFLKNNPLVNNAYYFDKIHELGKNNLYNLGAYYLQEPSSAVAISLLDIAEDDLILDMCSAPGGKAIEASLKCKNGVLVANDISKSRINSIIENIERMGIDNIVVTNSDFSLDDSTKKILNKFDHVILDAPCSGSGMFRKENKMFDDWSIEKVYNCSFKQKQLILNAYKMLKPGGTMVYSTCSYSYQEDEDVVKYLLNNSDAFLLDIKQSQYFYRSDLDKTVHLFPSLFNGEGQYIALIKKPGNSIKTQFLSNKSNYLLTNKLIKLLDKRDNIKIDNTIYSLNRKVDLGNIYIIRYGIKVCNIENGIVKPEHHLSRFLNSVNSIALTDDQYNQYIKGYELTLNNSNDGWNIVSYKNLNVGFVKIKNKKAKNHYPKGLRI